MDEQASAPKSHWPLKHLDVDVLRKFRASSYAPLSARKRLEYLRSFFRFCQDSGLGRSQPRDGREGIQGRTESQAATSTTSPRSTRADHSLQVLLELDCDLAGRRS